MRGTHFAMPPVPWTIHHPSGAHRVLVTRELLGDRWLAILKAADCRVEVNPSDAPLSESDLIGLIGNACAGLIGQLSDPMTAPVFRALKQAGARVYSNYAVGYNNVDVAAANSLGIAVGNTPGVLTHATAELAVALTFAAARRIVEADRYTREGHFTGWGLRLFLGELLHGKTLGVVGAGRIGSAYARMLAQGHRMHLRYFSRSPKPALETEFDAFNAFLRQAGEPPITVRRAETLDALLAESDVVGLFPSLNDSTRHLIDARRLSLMKPAALLINVSRGPVVDEAALVSHLRTHPEFRAGLDVYEREPALEAGLTECPNAVLMPHIGSGTGWTREAMAVIAARNVAAVLRGWPAGTGDDMVPYLCGDAPQLAPSIINAAEIRKS
jgi:hydroxypyruvate reductase 1